MLKIRVIPTLTVKGQRLVKSVQFAEHRNIGNYIAAVRVFNARDVDELIFLDLDARERGIDVALLSDVTKECFMPVTLGGGVKTIDDVQKLLSLGADKVAINSAAFTDPELIEKAAARYGSQCVVVSIDAKKEGEGVYALYVDGGQRRVDMSPVEWAMRAEHKGAGEILLNSIDHDGMMDGYDPVLIQAVATAARIPVIALGGAGKPSDCVEAVKKGASAVSAGSIFQYTQTTPQNIKEALRDAGFPARF